MPTRQTSEASVFGLADFSSWKGFHNADHDAEVKKCNGGDRPGLGNSERFYSREIMYANLKLQFRMQFLLHKAVFGISTAKETLTLYFSTSAS